MNDSTAKTSDEYDSEVIYGSTHGQPTGVWVAVPVVHGIPVCGQGFFRHWSVLKPLGDIVPWQGQTLSVHKLAPGSVFELPNSKLLATIAHPDCFPEVGVTHWVDVNGWVDSASTDAEIDVRVLRDAGDEDRDDW